MQSRRPFRYFADPVCIGSVSIYLLNRFYLKPHHIGGEFTHGYLNDILCLPLFLPLILYVQHVIGLRSHDAPPRLWEIVQHAAIFSVVFEGILPRYPQYFRMTADPLDAVAYLVGGLTAGVIWWAPTWLRFAGVHWKIRGDLRQSRPVTREM
jgi:hypothetical protein